MAIGKGEGFTHVHTHNVSCGFTSNAAHLASAGFSVSGAVCVMLQLSYPFSVCHYARHLVTLHCYRHNQ